ncbi:MAG TPA: M28 family peptidase [Gemmatimonadales bacterium]
MTDYPALLREIAVPRLAGSLSQARMMEPLKRELTNRGFTIAEQRFRAKPTGLIAMAFLGGVVAWTGLAVLSFGSAEPGSDVSRFVLIGLGLAALFLGTPLRGALGGRATGAINLIATRGEQTPRVWLVAHYDAKGQVFSMATRLLLAGCAGLGATALLALAALARLGAAPPAVAWTAAAIAALLGGGPLTLNAWLRDSPGAVDNATGILTVLSIVDRLPPGASIGVLLPDAEELGLVGARAFARQHRELLRDAIVVNVDGIDDRGATIGFVHRAGPIVDAVTAALGARRARWLPVVVDGLALRAAARECMTVMRGGWATMRVVHTRRDTANRLTLQGVREVAEGVAVGLVPTLKGGLGDTMP